MLAMTRRKGFAAAVAVALTLAGCTGAFDKPAETAPSASEVAARAGGPQAATPTATPPASTVIPEPPPPEIVKGTGRLVGRTVPHTTGASVGEDGGITLNFVNADVRDVAKAVFGDFLNVNYSIGAGVQGTITVQTSKPLSRSEVLPVFEQILRMNGLAIVKSNDVYKVVLAADAPREVAAAASSGTNTGDVGYGTQIVPLHYVSAAEMQRLLDGMAPSQAIIHADTGRNLLIVQGTQQERQAVVDEVALFDVDWLAGMSFGLFTPKYTDAKGLAKELDQILGGTGGPLSGVIKLIPIERLNAVLVISPQPRYLDQVQRWVARLDRPGVGSDRRIFVYAVQNGRASDLASTLKKVLYGSASSNDNGKGDNSGDTNGDTATPPPAAATGGSSGAGTPPPAPSGSNTSLIVDNGGSNNPPPGAATITADETNNAVVIYGTPQEYASIESALRQLDVAPLQVLIEAAIAEVTLTNDLQYGVQYAFNPSSKHSLVLSSGSSATIGPSFPGFSYIFSDTNIKVVLDALSQVTHVEVVSAPDVLVLNNHTANLQVGDQVPIATSQAVGVVGSGSPIVNTIEYRSTGIILKVTPRVNQGGMVTLDISQEVSDVSSTNTSTLDSPTITQRKIDSTIAVQDNETIVLGGLIKDSRTRGSSGLPFLSEVPVVGALFGSKSNNFDRTELIVLLTPHVIDNLQKARAITDELKRKLPALQTLMQRR